MGYSEAIYAARGETREQNETEATLRVRALAAPAIDDATASRLQDEGARLRDTEIGELAFATHDAG